MNEATLKMISHLAALKWQVMVEQESINWNVRCLDHLTRSMCLVHAHRVSPMYHESQIEWESKIEQLDLRHNTDAGLASKGPLNCAIHNFCCPRFINLFGKRNN